MAAYSPVLLADLMPYRHGDCDSTEVASLTKLRQSSAICAEWTAAQMASPGRRLLVPGGRGARTKR